MITPLLITLFKWSETIGFLSMAAFITQYTFLGKWWKNSIGLTIVTEALAIMLVLFPSMLHIYLGVNTDNNPLFAWYTLVSFTLIPVIFISRIVSFELIRRRLKKVGRRHDAPRDTDFPGRDVPATPR
jgi:ABC-type multidrug transport system permease subunit